MNLSRIQLAIRQQGMDGWLFYDFHNHDLLAYRILGLDARKMTTRRWYYFIPAEGEPSKLVHAIEAGKLDPLPGMKETYLPWTEQHAKLRKILAPAHRIAMQYSPLNALPSIAMVDAGTVELIRGFGKEVVSSADLVQTFEAVIDGPGFASHLEAGRRLHTIMDGAFRETARRLRTGQALNELELQQFIVDRYHDNQLICDGDYPIVAVNAHAADPHFVPAPETAFPIRTGDLLLLDLWAKLDAAGSIYFDITWIGYLGDPVPPEIGQHFQLVRQARDRAVEFARQRLREGNPPAGWEVDEACRQVIAAAGCGGLFIHRTGHSIGETAHGHGVNFDNLETRDERRLAPGLLCSVEPGVYLPGRYGIRSEINVYVNPDNELLVTGPCQQDVIRVFDL